MESVRYLQATLRAWYVVVLMTLAGAAGGLLMYLHVTPLYATNAQYNVTMQTSGDANADATNQGLAASRADALARVVGTKEALTRLGQDLHISAKQLSVGGTASPLTSFVTVTVVSDSPQVAQAVANGYGTVGTELVNDVFQDVEPRARVILIGEAPLPAEAFTPVLWRNLSLGLVAGFVLGLGLVLLRELLNQTIASEEDAAQASGERVLAAVPRTSAKVKVPVLSEPRGLRAEAYRRVRTALLREGAQDGGTFAITSALAGEGKTTVATNVSLGLARAGFRTIVVDADLRRPRVEEFYELHAEYGLVDVVLGRAPLERAVVAAPDDRLAVLTAGAPYPDSSELLGTDEFGALLAKLRQEFDFVILDTPPIVPVTDTLVMAPLLTGFVVVTQLGRTRRREFVAALRALRENGGRIVGIVANRTTRATTTGYRYGYYSSDRARAAAPRHRGDDAQVNGEHSPVFGDVANGVGASMRRITPRPRPRPAPHVD